MSAEAVMMGASALAQIASQYNTNLTNRKIAKDNIGLQLSYNADQIGVAQMNNQTQIDLANTAHQREVNDLRDAGLNPILSATGGHGAATPALQGFNGAAAQDAYHEENPLKELGVSAREIGRYMSQAYEAQVEQSKEAAKSIKLDNEIQKENLTNLRFRSLVDRTYNKAEYDALTSMRHKFIDDSGNELIMVNSDGAVMLNSDYIEDLAAGIKADLHNRKWSDVRNWIDTGLRAVDTGVGAYTDITNPARFRIPHKGR